MTVLTRIVAAAALVSIAFADIAHASAAENYELAAQRARALSHHERASIIKAASGEAKKRGMHKKRCKNTTTTSSVSLSTTHTPDPPKYTPTSSSTTSTTVPANPVNTPSKPSSGAGKKLLPWSGTNAELDNVVNSNVAFLYTWSAQPVKRTGLKSASMLWGNKNLDDFIQYRDQYDYLMGPNEFNLDSQAGMSVSAVVQMWNQYVRPMGSKGKFLVCPSVTTAPSGISELKEFFNTCGGNDNCGCDVLSAHYYGTESSGFITYVTELHNTFNMNVWVTETACQGFSAGQGDCTEAQIQDYMKGVVEFCEKTTWITAYGFYGWADDLGLVNQNNALISGGEPTALGKYFLTTTY